MKKFSFIWKYKLFGVENNVDNRSEIEIDSESFPQYQNLKICGINLSTINPG